jgi:hypothetical protein
MFRAGSVAEGFRMIGAMFSGGSHSAWSRDLLERLLTGEAVFALVLSALFAQPLIPRLKSTALGKKVLEPVSWAFCLVLFVLCLAQLSSGGFTPFIYAQF